MITARRARSSRDSASAAHHRQAALVEQIAVFLQRLRVLAVGGADAADRRHPQPDQVAIGLRAVALEVAVQPALALGHRQRIVGQREMVHADVDVAGATESRERLRQHRQLGAAARQFRGTDAALRLEALGQVRVAVQARCGPAEAAPPAASVRSKIRGVCRGRP